VRDSGASVLLLTAVMVTEIVGARSTFCKANFTAETQRHRED
jgi:hypothetical protein